MGHTSQSIHAASRRRHLDAVVIAEMARSLHRDASRERESVRESLGPRASVCAGEAGLRVHTPRMRAARPRRPALTA
ncbi:MAG TPA: hypothetical protein VGY13_05475 [Solirubrobacteraceae bacterium]|jgi:hypothetical protein|nr:hypothetical protein [Solirubrobacteraceae bacterium]